MIKRITSKENLMIKRVKQLEIRKYRERFQQFIVEGSTLLSEALFSGKHAISSVLYRDDFLKEPDSQELINALLKENIPVYSLDQSLFHYIASTETPKGIIGVIEKPAWKKEDMFASKDSKVLVLDRVQDPGNVGTILRTAEAAGYDGILVVKGTADPYSAKVVRAAAGAVLRVPVLYLEDAMETLGFLRDQGKKILCTAPGAAIHYHQIDMASNLAIVIGNEASGACDAFMEGADFQVSIPMEGDTESLNAAVAASILMYESVRQRYGKE